MRLAQLDSVLLSAPVPEQFANSWAGGSVSGVFRVEFPAFPNPFRDERLEEPRVMRDRMVQPPTAPGLGVRPTERTIERYPYRSDLRTQMVDRSTRSGAYA